MERPNITWRQAIIKKDQRNCSSTGVRPDPEDGGWHDRTGTGQLEN